MEETIPNTTQVEQQNLITDFVAIKHFDKNGMLFK